MSSSHLAKTAKTLLYNVILFPEGWLVGAKDDRFLRSACIPEVVLLLYTVLHETGEHEECVQLSDILASEKHGLYRVSLFLPLPYSHIYILFYIHYLLSNPIIYLKKV